jgi:hypothetical protein
MSSRHETTHDWRRNASLWKQAINPSRLDTFKNHVLFLSRFCFVKYDLRLVLFAVLRLIFFTNVVRWKHTHTAHIHDRHYAVPYSRVFPENLKVAPFVHKICHCHGTKGSQPWLQKPTTGPHPMPGKPPHVIIPYVSQITFVSQFHVHLVLSSYLFLSYLPAKILRAFIIFSEHDACSIHLELLN